MADLRFDGGRQIRVDDRLRSTQTGTVPRRTVRSDGSTWDGSGLSGTEAIINANLATAVEAKVGHGLVVSLGTPRGLVQIPVTVKEIVRDEGRGEIGRAS